MSDRVLITITDGVADVVFNRADKRNALDNAMFTAIAEAGEQLKSETGLRSVVLSGDGASFCAGLDFSSFQAMAGGDDASSAATRTDGNPGQMKDGRITHLGQQVCWVWQELEVPVIAAVHGHALGGGLQIALGADIRIVHPDTKMSVREVYWGLVPDMTGTFVLSKLVRPDIKCSMPCWMMSTKPMLKVWPAGHIRHGSSFMVSGFPLLCEMKFYRHTICYRKNMVLI